MARLRPATLHAFRPLLLALSGALVWLGGGFPVALTTSVLILILGSLCAISLRAPSAVLWRLPLLALVLVALPLSWTIHAQPLAIGWVTGWRLAWTLALMCTLATRPGRRGGWLGIDPRIWLLLAAGGLLPWMISAPNERAGTVAPYLPLVVALLFQSGSFSSGLAPHQPRQWATPRSLVLLGATAYLAIVLVQAGSRGGALAAVGGCVAARLSRVRGAPQLRAVVWSATVALAIITCGVAVPAGRELLAHFVTDGSPQGISWYEAASGRPIIWQRALLMIEDTPFTGLGLGAFGATAAVLYPMPFAAGGALEDAHQFALQTWLDLGLVGLIASAWLVWRALGIAWRAARCADCRDQQLAGGLFGGLVAWLIFGLGDAVALGTVGSVTFWMFLGMVWTLAAAARPPRASRGANALGAGLVIALLAVVCSHAGRAAIERSFERNLASLDVYRAVFGGQAVSRAMERIQAVATASSCQAWWLAGALSAAVDRPAGQAKQWRQLLHCDERYVDVMAVAVAQDRSLAYTAVQVHPTSARAWRWWAASAGQTPSPAARRPAIVAWRRAAALAPRQGVSWRRLGDLLVLEQELVPAMDAYAAACTHGDPGANGCVLAASVAERLGDRRQAAAFLFRSRWQPARARAKRLTEPSL